MIFVTVGSSATPFDRLIDAAAMLGPANEKIIVQHGVSGRRPANASNIAFLPFDELRRHIREARVVVCHGGVGSVLLAFANDKHPIVMPRRAALGEAVDDHQHSFCARLAREGLVTVVENGQILPQLVPTFRGGARGNTSVGGTPLVAELKTYLTATIARSQAGEQDGLERTRLRFRELCRSRGSRTSTSRGKR